MSKRHYTSTEVPYSPKQCNCGIGQAVAPNPNEPTLREYSLAEMRRKALDTSTERSS